MTAQNCRIKVKIGDFEFEVEGDSSFVLEQFRSTKLQERVEQLVKEEALLREKTTTGEKPLVKLHHRSPQEFFNEKGRPGTTAERVAVIGYWLEHLADEKKPIFKNEEILDQWTKTLRLPPPKFPSTLCRDAKNKGWLNPAGNKMGYWQLSLQGRDFVEKELPPKSEP